MAEQDGVVPIYGVQTMEELEQWLALADEDPRLDDEMRAIIESDRAQLSGQFCRGCGYCMPCPADIKINNCARTSLLLRRSPSANWLTPAWQAEMEKIENCLNCGQCMSRCPYELNTPELLRKNLEDYRTFLK
jgi:predicted aldo/keto reductase-like oxidoreductase